ncbi:MAG: hypothetical protein Q4D58_08850 [Synergistaceae bacterium]|nr:hypothetical protein [Synergistaceae bacterium]
MSSFDIVVEIRNAILSVSGITNVYDSLVTPDKVSSVVSPYACIGEFRKIQGRVMDESEQKCFVDVFIWTRYKGKKQCMELADAFESSLAELNRDYFLEAAYFDYDEESGWSLAQITLRTYLE